MRHAFVALALVACEGEPIDRSTLPVVNGSPSAGRFPPVGAIHYQGTFEGMPVALVACTGALVAADVVLTAAHCVDPYITSMVGLPRFSLDDDTTLPSTTWREVASVRLQDGYVSQQIFHIFLEDAHDVALVFLAQPVTGVTPMRIAGAGEAGLVTSALELQWVGYGQTVIGDDATRGLERFAPTRATEIGGTELRHVGQGTPAPCVGFGDSGGPVVGTAGGEQVMFGITSHGGAMTLCGSGGDIAERVDAYAAWIVARAPAVCGRSPGACAAAAPDAGPAPPADAGAAAGDGEGGGCAVGGRRPGGAAWALLVLLALRRRTARTPRRQTASG